MQVSAVAYKLDLPGTLRIHPIFHVSLLRQYWNPSQIADRPPLEPPPPPVTINDVPEYEVERILDHRQRHKQKEYLVKWMGYPDHDATWEPSTNLTHVSELLEEYMASWTMLEEEGSNVMESQVMCMSRDQSCDQTPEDQDMPSGNVMRYHDTPKPGVNTINSLSINSTELSAPSH